MPRVFGFQTLNYLRQAQGHRQIGRGNMILTFDDDVYSANADGGRLLARQAELAKTTVQIASLDGSNSRWTRLTEPCLLVVSRGKTVRLSGDEIDDLIAACNANGEFAFGGGDTPV